MKVRVLCDGRLAEKEYTAPVSVFDVLSECVRGGFAPCGGRGICGGCRVHIEGSYEPFSRTGDVLACQTRVTGDAYIIYNTSRGKIQVLSANDMPQIAAEGENCEYCALDIGTTTLAAAVFDGKSGRMIASFGEENPQTAHGADVISRLQYSASGGAQTLKDEIASSVAPLLRGRKCAVAGNTAMMCLFRGLDVSGMLVHPFTPPSLFGYEEENVYYAPCASAFFGADAVCAVAHCIKEDEISIVADIGTNGEIACFDGKDIYCLSAPAGPCFEGGGVTCGTPAFDGAVRSVKANGTNAEYDVIGGGDIRGICGTGIAEIAAFLLGQKKLSAKGYLPQTFYITENVFVTQEDVRAVLLAKAAIRAGIETLLDISNTRGKVCRLYLAGGFGSALSPRTAAALGIIPPGLEEICVPAGNAALYGAARAVSDNGFRKKLERIAAGCRCIEPANDKRFAGHFINSMCFGG